MIGSRAATAARPQIARGSRGIRLNRRFVGFHPREEQRRDDERDRVHGERDRGGQHLHEGAPERRADDVRQGPAAVQQRASLDLQLTRRDGHEHRRPGRIEQDSQRADEEPHHVQLLDRQDAGDVRHGNTCDQRGAADVHRDHDAPAMLDPLQPDACRHREQEVRQQQPP